jgi:hypothetical protein
MYLTTKVRSHTVETQKEHKDGKKTRVEVQVETVFDRVDAAVISDREASVLQDKMRDGDPLADGIRLFELIVDNDGRAAIGGEITPKRKRRKKAS